MIRIDIVYLKTFSGASIGCTTVYPGFNITIIAFSIIYKLYIIINFKYLIGLKYRCEETLKSLEKYRGTDMIGTPTMVIDFLNSPVLKKYDISALKNAILGGAPRLTSKN